MKVIKTIRQMQKVRKRLNRSVGFIPTMGYLHAGHASLITLAKKKTDAVVISIFVNPKQFLPGEDFKTYPRDTKGDIKTARDAGADYLFLPELEEMYPNGYKTHVIVSDIADKLEGKIRPGHFTGVATVVTKLFNIIQPTHAFFGQKDAQQVIVMKKMIADLNMPIQLVVESTLRENDGLAMSSRNVYLTKVERKEALVLYQSLKLAKKLFENEEKNPNTLKTQIKKLIDKTKGVIDYISISDPVTLEEVKLVKQGSIVSVAVKFGKTRLIDNIIL